MKRLITFHFSFSAIVEGKSVEDIIITAEKQATENLGKRCFQYCDDDITSIEEVKE